jgi:hypothetical protein
VLRAFAADHSVAAEEQAVRAHAHGCLAARTEDGAGGGSTRFVETVSAQIADMPSRHSAPPTSGVVHWHVCNISVIRSPPAT